MDRGTFAELMAGMWQGLGRNGLPPAAMCQLWYLALHDLTERQFAAAITTYLATRADEWPTPKIMREVSGVQTSADTAAVDAWTVALESISLVGGYATPEYNDPVISHVIQSLGGWVWFCDQEPDDLREFCRARFLNTYKALRHKIRHPARLIGLIEQTGGEPERLAVGRTAQGRIGVLRGNDMIVSAKK